MILERLVLHNFGPYLGRHEIDLSPSPPKRPVILFGGMNGGGKTTILTALQLALFGRMSNVWQSHDSAYDTFLRKAIHRRATAEDGAGIEISFRSAVQGTTQTIHLCRYWRETGSKIKEVIDVIRDGEIDTVLSENWADWVEEFIPSRVAPLFFFDGERVEELANPDRSAEILKSAIHSLLGLDIVDQLQSDLEILERRKRGAAKGKETSPHEVQARELEAEHTRIHNKLQGHHQELASQTNTTARLEKKLADLEKQLSNQGGELFENRHQLEESRDQLTAQAAELEDQLRELSAGALPLALLMPQLDALEALGRSSVDESIRTTVLQVLDQRDQALLDHLRKLRNSKSLLGDVAAFLEEDRGLRRAAGGAAAEALDSGTLARTHALRVQVVPTDIARAEALLKKLGDLDHQTQNVERKLAGLPDEERIKPLLAEREATRLELDEARRAQEVSKELIRIETQEVERTKGRLEATRLALAESMLDDEDCARTLRHSMRARETLDRFRSHVLTGHVRRIERLALECFTTLMRKQYLVRELHIDPSTFAVELQDEDGHRVPPQKLSAGERQLLAIALLWGLSRASGRPLPTVIDTPLGRLDSSHRRNLVERYFPFASHQVILLSTDEEIDEEFYRDMQPQLARSFLLDFDDRKQATTVRDGYFWEASA